MSAVVRVARQHECDTRTFVDQAESEDLGSGSIFRCGECGQRWLLRTTSRYSLSLEPVGTARAVWAWLIGR